MSESMEAAVASGWSTSSGSVRAAIWMSVSGASWATVEALVGTSVVVAMTTWHPISAVRQTGSAS